MLSPEELRLAVLAFIIRGTVVLLATALDCLLPDYDTSKFITSDLSEPFTPLVVSKLSKNTDDMQWGTFDSPRAAGQLSSTPSSFLQGWLVWDSVFFADIAARGYLFEQYYAFFPLFPGIISRVPSRLIPAGALMINAVASVISTVLLFRLGERITRDRQLALLACVFFIFNPATIFHAAPYTEASFTAATLAALYWLHCHGRLAPAIIAVAVSCGLRSNGVVNAGYLGHYSFRRALATWPSSKVRAMGQALLGFVAAGAAVLPVVAFQVSAFTTFCRQPSLRDEGPEVGHPLPRTADWRWPRPWCSSRLPYVYGFVQSEYWNVGFLRYWTLQQLPNFLLAAPVVVLSAAGLTEYFQANMRHVLLRLGLTPLSPVSQAPPCKPAKTEDPTTGPPMKRPSDDPDQPTKSPVLFPDLPRPNRTGLRHRTPVAGRRCHGRRVNSGVPAGRADGPPDKLRDAYDVGGSGSGLVEEAVTRDGQGGSGSSCGAGAAAGTTDADGRGSLSGYLDAEVAVLMYPWLFNLVVAVTSMHVQVATRFLLSACPPLYLYMAHLCLGRGAGGPRGETASSQWLSRKVSQEAESAGRAGDGVVMGGVGSDGWWAVALWRWCLVYMVAGCVLFINFYPWT